MVLNSWKGATAMNDVNERIKILRSEILGLTMESFAERLGVTRSAISNIESGRRNVSEQVFRAIIREFGVREDWLRNGEGEALHSSESKEIDELVKRYDLSELDRIILNKWMALSVSQRRVLDDFVLDVFSEYSGDVSVEVVSADTASNQERLEAYEEYLTQKKKAEGE
jgi:transcriptional regulator with XRE-family HTH domain